MRTQTPETTIGVQAFCIASAGRTHAFVIVNATAGRACVSLISGGTIATMATLHIGTNGARATSVRLLAAFVNVNASIMRIAIEPFRTLAREITGQIQAKGIRSAHIWPRALVHI